MTPARHLRELLRVGRRTSRRRLSAHAAAAGPWYSDAARAMCSGARSGSCADPLPELGGRRPAFSNALGQFAHLESNIVDGLSRTADEGVCPGTWSPFSSTGSRPPAIAPGRSRSPANGPGIVLLHGWSDSADTWRPLLAQLGSRGRRAIAVDLPGFGEATRLHDGAVLPAAGRLRRRPRRALGGRRAGRGRRHLARRLPRAAAGRDPGDLRLAGVVPVAPDGLEMPSWFDPIEEDPIVRKLLSIPVPVPGVLVRRAKSSAYRQLAFLPASSTQRAVVDALRPRRRDARGPRGAAGVRPRARAGALHRPVRPGRHPLPRAARVGRPRPDAAAHRRPRRARLAARRRRSS